MGVYDMILTKYPNKDTGNKMRGMINNLLIIITFLMLLSACQHNPSTILSEQELQQLTSTQIMHINQQSCLQQDKYAVMVRPTHKLQQYLDTLTQSLPQSIANQTLNYRVYLHTQPDAWATSNGCIRITSSLLNHLTAQEVQAVIAHEIGHIALHHSEQRFQMAKYVEIKDNGEIMLLVPKTLSWQQELEADRYAVLLLKQHHIDPNGLISMLDKLSDYHKEQSQSHPSILIRKNHILTWIQP